MLDLEKHEIFIENINNKIKMNVKFHSNKTNRVESRDVAPLDYAIISRSQKNKMYYWVWDFQWTKWPHPTPLSKEKIISIETINEKFEPNTFINWDINKNPWNIKRDWWELS